MHEVCILNINTILYKNVIKIIEKGITVCVQQKFVFMFLEFYQIADKTAIQTHGNRTHQ